MPRVSVIVTTSGRWELLDHALASILSQDFEDYEILLINDGVTNPVRLEVVKAYNARDPRIRWAECMTPATKRVSASINLGLDRAKGEFITYLCDDDFWLPGRLSRMMKAVEGGADWVIDKVRWVRPDGMLVDQGKIGQYQYAEPFEDGHEKLAQLLIDGFECNFIVHDCVLHRLTKDRWPTDDEHHTPVDWRFWCSLWRRANVHSWKIEGQNVFGAVAYYPGSWRAGMTNEQAVDARLTAGLIGGTKMGKKLTNDEEREARLVGYARNTSGKRRKFTRAGTSLLVPPDGVVEVRKIALVDDRGNVRLPPGFTPEMEDLLVPALDGRSPLAGDKPALDMDAVIDMKTAEPVKTDKPKEKSVGHIPSAEDLADMSYNDVRGLARAVGVTSLNRKRVELVKDIEKARGTGSKVGGCFDDQTMTTKDFPKPD